jgi:hypothetical protein
LCRASDSKILPDVLSRMRVLGMSIALVAALGCSEQGEPSKVQPMRDAGSTPGGAFEPTQPHVDAGSLHDASPASDSGAAQPQASPNFTLECSGEPARATAGDPRSTWEAERAAHGALGHAATFTLRGAAYRVQGVALADVSAPFTLRTGHVGSGLVSFGDAEVEDVEERGRLELYAGGDEPGRMPASAGAIEGLALKTVAVEDGVLEGAIDVTDESVGNTHLYRANASVSGLALEDISQAYLYPEGSIGLDGRIEWMPSDAVVVLRKAASLTFYEADVGSVQKTMSAPLDLDYDAFGVAGDFSAGALDVKDVEVRGTPLAIFGRAARLRAGADEIEAPQTFRLTQAINDAGLVLPAAVEIVPEASEVWVPPSKTKIVRLHYRERSYRGDAVLGEIKSGGSASDLLELQTGFPQTLTGELIGAVRDTGWAAPVIAITTLPAIPIVFVIDLFKCLFGGCANQPPPLEPFPQWIDAGAIGTMEVRVKGNLAPGTYETTLTFIGRNYCPVTVPLTIHIGDPPPSDMDAGL